MFKRYSILTLLLVFLNSCADVGFFNSMQGSSDGKISDAGFGLSIFSSLYDEAKRNEVGKIELDKHGFYVKNTLHSETDTKYDPGGYDKKGFHQSSYSHRDTGTKFNEDDINFYGVTRARVEEFEKSIE